MINVFCYKYQWFIMIMSEEGTNQRNKLVLTLKIGAVIVVSTFLLYPKPLMSLFKPLIQHYRKFYHQTKPQLTKIIFSANKKLTPHVLIREKLVKAQINDIIVINLFEQALDDYIYLEPLTQYQFSNEDSDNEQKNQKQIIQQLWAQNIVHELRLLSLQAKENKNNNIVILVKGKQQILRIVEAKLYKLKSIDYYKIPQFQLENQMHILERTNINTYEHNVLAVQ